MTTYTYTSRQLQICTTDMYVDLKATIEGPDNMRFMVECKSEAEYAIRFFESSTDAGNYGKAFNKRAARKDLGAWFEIHHLTPKAGK